MPDNNKVDISTITVGTIPQKAVDATDSKVDITNLGAPKVKPTRVVEGTSYKNLDVSKYSPYMNEVRPDWGIDQLNRDRAEGQSGFEQAGHSLVQAVKGEILGGTISSIGAIAELPFAIAEEVNGQDADFSNFLTEIGDDLTESAKENNPIYRKDPNKSFDIGDSAWWYSNLPSVASSLSMLAPAWGMEKGISLLGKLSNIRTEAKALKLTAEIEKLREGATALKEAGKLEEASVAFARAFELEEGALKSTKLGDTAKQWGKIATGAVTMRQAENFRESLQLYNKTRAESLANFENNDELYQSVLSSGLPDSIKARLGEDENINKEIVAEYVASKAGWKAYQVNAVNVLFDALQFAPLVKGLPIMSRSNAWYNMESSVAKLLNREFSTAQKAARIFTAGKTGSLMVGAASEGVEEIINGIGQNEGQYVADRYNNSTDEKAWYRRLGANLTDASVLEQGFWGALGGLAFEGLGHPIYEKASQFITGETQPDIATHKLNEIANRHVLQSAYIEQVAQLKQKVANKELSPDEAKDIYHELQSQYDTQIGLSAAKVGNVDLVLEQLDHPDFQTKIFESYSPEELKEIGVDDITKAVAKSKQNIINAETYYNKARRNFFTTDVREDVKNYMIDTHTMNNLDNIRLERQNDKLAKQLIDLKRNDFATGDNIESSYHLRALQLAISKIEQAKKEQAEKLGKDVEGVNFLAEKQLEKLKKERDALDAEFPVKASDLNPMIIATKASMILNGFNASRNTEANLTLETRSVQKKITEAVDNAKELQAKKEIEDFKSDINAKLVKGEMNLVDLQNLLKNETNEEKKAHLESKIKDITSAEELAKRTALAEQEKNKKPKAKKAILTFKNTYAQEQADVILGYSDVEKLTRAYEALEKDSIVEGYDMTRQEADALREAIAQKIKVLKGEIEEEAEEVEDDEFSPENPIANLRVKINQAVKVVPVTIQGEVDEELTALTSSANLFQSLRGDTVKEDKNGDFEVLPIADEAVKAVYELKEGDTIEFVIDTAGNNQLKADETKSKERDYDSKESISIAVLDSKGRQIGHLNDVVTLDILLKTTKEVLKMKLPALIEAQKTFNAETPKFYRKAVNWRLAELTEEKFSQSSNRTLGWFKTQLANNLANTKSIRSQIAKATKKGLPVKITSTITHKSAGQLITTEKLRNPSKVMGNQVSYWHIDRRSGNLVVLKNSKTGQRFSRNATGTFTNSDAAYDDYRVYNLVPGANSDLNDIQTWIPSPITVNTVNADIAAKVNTILNNIVKLLNEGVSINSEKLADLRRQLDLYVVTRDTGNVSEADKAKAGFRIYSDKTNKRGRIEFVSGDNFITLYSSNPKTNTPTIRITDKEGKSTYIDKTDSNYNDELKKLLMDVPRNINFDGLADDSASYEGKTYTQFLDSTGAWGTDLGILYSSKGEKIGYAINDNNRAAMVISVSSNLSVEKPSDGIEAKKADKERRRQEELEKKVQILKDKRNALRGEDGVVPKENIAEWQQLGKDVIEAQNKATRGNNEGFIPIRTEKDGVLSGEDAINAENEIERVIQKIIKGEITIEQAVSFIHNKYKVLANENGFLLNYINDRTSNAPEIGNNKQSFPAWRKGKYDAELAAKQIMEEHEANKAAVEEAVQTEFTEEEHQTIEEEKAKEPESQAQTTSEFLAEQLSNQKKGKTFGEKFAEVLKKFSNLIKTLILGGIITTSLTAFTTTSDGSRTLDVNSAIESTVDLLPQTTQEFVKRGLEKFGVLETKDNILEDTNHESKKEVVQSPINQTDSVVTPQVETYFQQVGVVADSYNTNDSLLSYRSQWDNSKGFRYIPAPNKGQQNGQNIKISGVRGVGHFLLDASLWDNKAYSHPYNEGFLKQAKEHNHFVPAFTRLEDGSVLLKYKKFKDLTKDDIVVAPLRQMTFADISFDKVGDAKGFKHGVHEIKKKDGTGTYLLFKDRKGYSRFSGGSVVFLFKDANGNTVVRDYAGSLNGIEMEGLNILKEFNLKPQDLTLGYHDVGSFSAKPKAHGDEVNTSQYAGFNNEKMTGGALLIPTQTITVNPVQNYVKSVSEKDLDSKLAKCGII